MVQTLRVCLWGVGNRVALRERLGLTCGTPARKVTHHCSAAALPNLFYFWAGWTVLSLSMGWMDLASGPNPAHRAVNRGSIQLYRDGKGAWSIPYLATWLGGRGPGLVSIHLHRVWGIWQQCRVAVLLAITPLPPNFLTCGEPHGLSAMALYATFGS